MICAVSVLISYIFKRFTTVNADIIAFMPNVPIINAVMPKLIIYAIVYSIFVSISLYTKDN